MAAVPSWRRPTRARWGAAGEVGLFVAVFAYGIFLRAWDLGAQPFWVDEAESSINALTIQTHDVPVDRYLGLPIYENLYTKPWPGNAEYEFRDSSYSDKGLAVYHGWLPLYAISASFRAAGVRPDADEAFRGVKYSPDELRRRTAAGRWPSVVFSVIFLSCAFLAGRALYGADAGWAAMAVGALCKPAVEFGRQARYYSATVALTTLVCLAVWLMYRRGRWRDFLLGAVAFSLLFHTHVLSFMVACGAAGLLLPGMWRHDKALRKMLVCGMIVGLAVVPWVLLTGFLGASPDIPKARDLLAFPADWVAYPRKHYLFTIVAALSGVWLLLVGRLRAKLPARLIRPFLDHRPALLWLAAWAVLGYVAFLLLIPSASYFYRRMTLTVMGPALLFMAILFTAVGRAIHPRLAGAVGAGLFLAALGVFNKVQWKPEPTFAELSPTWDVIEHLRMRPIPPGTKLYATPNDHLTLTFYTGMPVGCVAPVRKSFLDRYPGRVLILEAPRYEWLDLDEIVRVAGQHGFVIFRDEARQLEPATRHWLTRQDLRGHVAEVRPAAPDVTPPVYQALLAYQQWKTERGVENAFSAEGNPLFKGFHGAHYGAWWQTFFYRFVHPERRTGANLNYASRVKSATADVLPMGWVVYDCPPVEENGRRGERETGGRNASYEVKSWGKPTELAPSVVSFARTGDG